MAAKKSNNPSLPDATIVTVVRYYGNNIGVKDMNYGKAKELLKKRGKVRYVIYQLGFCQVKANKEY